MPQTPVPDSHGEVYQEAWKASLALWPLLFLEFVFALLRYAVFFICALALFGPLVEKYGKELADAADKGQAVDWTPLLADLAALASKPSWMVLAAGVILLYATWWCLLSALLDGGMFRSLWAHWETGEPFSLTAFFRDAMHFFIPMIWLQVWLSLYLLIPLLGISALFSLVVGLLALTGFNTAAMAVCALLLGLPLLFLSVAAAVVFAVYFLAAQASVTRGLPTRQALREAWTLCRANRWRLTKGLGLVFLVYMAASFGFRVFFGILGLLPVLGPLFSLLGMVAGMALALFLGLYLPSLTVVFFREGKLSN